MNGGDLMHQVRLTTKDIAFVEKGMPVLMIYPETGYQPILKITEEKDILALRDMLNRAYPVDKPCG